MRYHEFIIEYNQRVTLERQGPRIAQIAAQQGVDDPALALATLEQMDPTGQERNNSYRYMMWIINQFVQGKFRLEDGSRIKAALTTFDQIKSRLPANERDIGRYTRHTLEDLIDRLQNSTGVQSTSNINYQSFLNRPDIQVLYSGPYGLLAIPGSKQSSCELGSGTRWCTAARNDNRFDYYNKEGPLYVWIDRSGQKYQFHFEGTMSQFKDSSDRDMSYEDFKKLWKIPPVGKIFNDHIEQIPFLYVPDNFKTYELCLKQVENNGNNLRYVPEQLKTYEMCREAVVSNPLAIEYVPEQLKTYELCLDAVQLHGWTLNYVPDKLKTYELCLDAVHQDGRALQFVPAQLRTRDLCLTAIKDNSKAIEYVPDRLKTLLFYRAALKKNHKVKHHLPPEYLNKFSKYLLFL